MKEDVARIMALVAEGRISPDDAAELLEAIEDARRQDEGVAPAREASIGENPAGEPIAAAPRTDEPGAPPRASAIPPSFEEDAKAAFRAVVDNVERLARQAQEEASKVDWRGVAAEARHNARRGLDALRTGIEERSAGKVNLSWLLNDSAREVELPFTFPPGSTLQVDNECGDVRIVGGNDGCEVTANVRVRAGNPEEARRIAAEYTLAVEEADGTVRIRQPHAPGLSVRLSVTISEATRVEASADSGDVFVHDCRGAVRATSRTGDVTVEGSEGFVEARSETGDLRLSGVGGGAQLESGTGDISAEGIRGDVRARASSGDISLRALAAGSVEAETISGDISIGLIEGLASASEVSATTVSGRVTATVLASTEAEVELSTLRGETRCDLALVGETRSSGRIVGTSGSGGAKIRLHSVSGGVDLRAAPATSA